MDMALMEGNCEGLAELEQPAEVCHAITMKAIPPCMLEEGTDSQAECLAEAAEDIEDEMSGDESGADIVASCKCDAFKNIQKSLTTVRTMMCPPGRVGHNYYSPGYGYDATTLWFQYTLCQQQALSCWLFTSHWNQGDFGQYYLYDNLLGGDDVSFGGLDGDNVLPLLLLGGGLGGGSYGGLGGGAYGGHTMQRYRRDAEDCEGDDCPAESKTRRDTCLSEKYDDNGNCLTSKKRRGTEIILPICLAGQDPEFDACQDPASITSDTVIPSCDGDEDPVDNLCIPKPLKCTVGAAQDGTCLFECESRVLDLQLVCDGTVDCEGGQDEEGCERQGNFIFIPFIAVAAAAAAKAAAAAAATPVGQAVIGGAISGAVGAAVSS